ncbi:MAG: hypothetical protein K2X74_15870, partial [Acetobacteraceae bacterium]|nr:hypothetical protein [Acetobacteraceae bacterium]
TLAFMEQLDAATEVAFAEGRKATPLAAFRELLGKAPRAVDLRPLPEGDAPAGEDPHAIARAATEFQEAEAKAGRHVTIAAAVAHVQREKAA